MVHQQSKSRHPSYYLINMSSFCFAEKEYFSCENTVLKIIIRVLSCIKLNYSSGSTKPPNNYINILKLIPTWVDVGTDVRFLTLRVDAREKASTPFEDTTEHKFGAATRDICFHEPIRT